MTTPFVLGSLKRHLIGTGVVVVGWVAFSYLPKTAAGVNHAKKISRNFSFFRDIKYEPATMALVDEVVSDINSHQDKPVKRDGIQIFQTDFLMPSDVRHLGSSSTGAMIWLPIGTRPDADEVFHYHCTIENSEDMEKFCVFSRDAKKFLLARQIQYCEDGYSLVRCLIGLALIGAGSVIHYFLNSMLDLKKQLILKKAEKEGSAVLLERYQMVVARLSAKSRRVSLFYLALFGIPLYHLLVGTYSIYSESNIHDRLAALGPEYVRGGKEYYEKLITANKYTVTVFADPFFALPSGDFNQGRFSWFHNSLKATNKLAYFIELEEKMKKSTNT